MRRLSTAAVAIIGASALIGSLLTDALASHPGPLHGMARTQDRKFAVNGSLTVTGVLKVKKNINVMTGRLYAHGGAQIWKGLTVTSGVLKTASLEVTGAGPALFQAATVAGNLQAGAVSAGSLSTSGKLTSVGVDAGTGGLTTSGDISAKNINITGNLNTGQGNITTNQLTAQTFNVTTFNPSSITTSGAITAGSLTTTGNAAVGGALTVANGLTVAGLVATGTVDFSRANVTGIGSVGGNPATLTVGTAGSTSAPLTIQANNKSSNIGVNGNGALTVSSDLAVSGNVIASSLIAPNPSSSTTPGALTITGNGINLVGATNLAGGSDLNMSAGSNASSHIVANNDADVVGQVGVTVPANTTGEVTQTVNFAKSYSTRPLVTLTAASDPAPASSFTAGTSTPFRVWVTPNQASSGSTYTSFTIHYVPPTNVLSQYTVYYNYQVIGQ